MPRITAYPIGNGDTLRLDLRDGRTVLVDFADLRNANDPEDRRIDLRKELRTDLRKAGKSHYDVVAFTHLDDDHVRGSSEFFWFDHAAKYQGEGRIRISDLWVPASALTEVGTGDCARVIRQEARCRMRRGSGVRVFSRPDALKAWFDNEKLDMNSRRHLITDAGRLVPGFGKDDAGGVEFFVHSPFGFRRNERDVEDRNQDCLVLQVTFREEGEDTRALLMSDMPWDGLDAVVRVTKHYGNADRLIWDVAKLPHHCSYLSLSDTKGDDKTVPTENIRWLYEEAGRYGGVLLSSSWPIPAKGTADDRDVQPPHREAANYYRDVARKFGSSFDVTMERTVSDPRPTIINVTRFGAQLVSSVLAPAAALASTPVRAG